MEGGYLTISNVLPIFTLILIYFASLFNTAESHGSIDTPAPRGGLRSGLLSKTIDRDAPGDEKLFFPSGNKIGKNAPGRRSQILTANENWTLFEPTKKGFVWRAGVCGDERHSDDPNRGDHMKGGMYYWPSDKPRITATYESGGIVDAIFSVNANHHGFIELHICDVSKCENGEISEKCFTDGHCTQLRRAPNEECDSGTSTECGPIDPNYPGRWYIPCRRFPGSSTRIMRYGPGTMQFEVPNDLKCEHCVLHFYWVGANHCHVDGVVEYLTNDDAPQWGTCPDEPGPAWLNPLNDCGGRMFPEEYYHCADVRVV